MDGSFFTSPIELQRSASVRIRVVDENNRPVKGVMTAVTYIQSEDGEYHLPKGDADDALWKAYTDQSGYAVFKHIPLVSTISFDIESQKYMSESDVDIRNITSHPQTWVIHVGLPGSISGRVVYSDTNKPASGIEIVGKANKSFMATTDSDGKYTISGVAPGT
jgi:protocatechuate 3,4-dioxygenase beta subunit